jgi:hypothetical protein
MRLFEPRDRYPLRAPGITLVAGGNCFCLSGSLSPLCAGIGLVLALALANGGQKLASSFPAPERKEEKNTGEYRLSSYV